MGNTETTNYERVLNTRYYLYHKAENFWWISIIAVIFLQIVVLLTAIIGNVKVTNAVAFLSLLLTVGIVWLRQYSNILINQAYKCERLLLYSDGLGQPIPSYEMVIVRSWVMGKKMKSVCLDSPFFYSKLPKGLKRLLDNTAESAFFVSSLTKKMLYFLVITLIISLICAVTSLYTMFSVMPGNISIAPFAKATISLMVFFLWGDLAILKFRYHVANKEASKVLSTCLHLLNRNNVTGREIVEIVEDYNLILAQSPPVFQLIYSKYGPHLNQIYRESYWLKNNNTIIGRLKNGKANENS